MLTGNYILKALKDKTMKTNRQINQEVSVEIDDKDDMPIIINTGTAFINLNFDELEHVYLFAKEQLQP